MRSVHRSGGLLEKFRVFVRLRDFRLSAEFRLGLDFANDQRILRPPLRPLSLLSTTSHSLLIDFVWRGFQLSLRGVLVLRENPEMLVGFRG